MKQNKFTNSQKVFLLVASLLISQFISAVVIVNFPLDNTYTNTPSTYSAGNSGVRFGTTTGGTIGYSSGAGATVNSWNTTVGKNWYTTAINTSNFYSITVSAQVKSLANSGPKDFKLQYSLNNSTWIDVQNLPIMPTTLTAINPPINLPPACAFQSTIYIRMATRDLLNMVGGTLTAAGTSSIAGLVIAGDQLIAPTTQTSFIRVIAITPTSITIGSTPGTSNGRIILMNKTNTFTDPTDNYNPGTNPNYSGSGQQVIYNGSGTALTITVPSSTSEYWFRSYEYAEYTNQRRYLLSTAADNPKQCLLESIILPTYTNIKLTKAHLGGTITNPPSGTITNRGIFWSLTPGVTVDDNKVSENGTSTGPFSFLVSGLDRSTTIYFKAFVENLSGTSISEEANFPNIPVFSGTGNWENPSRWNVLEVPGSANTPIGDFMDSPVIDGICTVSSSITECNDLTINNGKSLIVNPSQSLSSLGTLTNSASNSGILIKSAKNTPNGSLIWANGDPSGTVEMWSKSYSDTRYHWQYFGIPVTGINAGTPFSGTGVRVRRYNEGNHDASGLDVGLWLPSAPGASMATTNDPMFPIVGYEVTQPSENKFTFSGTLNHNDILDYSLGYTAIADWKGDNIIANPFTAAIDITIAGGITSTNTDGNFYLYNAGSRDEWNTGGAGITELSPGQYLASNGSYAGQLGTPAEIPSMQGFLVKATGSGATITIPYSSVKHNTKPQRAPQIKQSVIVGTRIDVTGAKYSDKMWIFTSDNCTRKFDCGYDAVKLLGSALTPQLYASETEGDYQIDAVNDMNNTLLSFQPGNETNLKLKFTHQNLESKYASVYLIDLLENKTVDITTSGAEYAFTAISSPTSTPRFKIVTTPANVTGIDIPNEVVNIKMSCSQGTLFVQNLTGKSGNIVLYNMAGMTIRNVVLRPDGITTLNNLDSGAYIAKVTTESEKTTERLIIR